jgi:hypothetical protein
VSGTDHVLSKGFLTTGAAAYVLGQCVVPVAGTALDPNQMVIATTGAGGAGATSPLGLVQENVDLVKVQTGKAYATVAIAGIAFGIAGAAIAVGAQVIPSGAVAGQLLTSGALGSTNRPLVGIALSPATTIGDIFTVLLTPGARG